MRGAVDVREARLRHLLRYDRQGHAVRYQAGCRSLQGANCFPNGVTPCGSSDYRQCGSACFGNEVCQAFHLGPDSRGDIRTCACVDPAQSCTTSPANTCTPGPCPPGAACSSILQNGTESCDCRTP